jgi:hypothetical protein
MGSTRTETQGTTRRPFTTSMTSVLLMNWFCMTGKADKIPEQNADVIPLLQAIMNWVSNSTALNGFHFNAFDAIAIELPDVAVDMETETMKAVALQCYTHLKQQQRDAIVDQVAL